VTRHPLDRAITVTESRPRHRLAFATVAVGMGMLAALVIAEIALRSSGHEPWKDLHGHLDMPRMHEPDPALGWRSKEGRYVFGTTPIYMTFWPDHARATAPAPVRADAAIVVLGCSFVQGWALSDEETFAWKLQERFARTRVLNFGTAGYGTTQSLLALERYLEEHERTHGAAAARGPLIVVYGFSDFHASRSIAEALWLKTLAQGSGGLGATPYATLGGDGELQLHPPKTYPAWWLHRHLATVATLEGVWASFDAMKRTSQANAVTQKLLLELDSVVRQSGGRLLVALLSQFGPRTMAPFRALLAEHGIPTAECVHQGVWAKEMQVPVYGHPNAEINAYWAGCIAQAISDMAPELARGGT
jgi:hypothetical protein